MGARAPDPVWQRYRSAATDEGRVAISWNQSQPFDAERCVGRSPSGNAVRAGQVIVSFTVLEESVVTRLDLRGGWHQLA